MTDERQPDLSRADDDDDALSPGGTDDKGAGSPGEWTAGAAADLGGDDGIAGDEDREVASGDG